MRFTTLAFASTLLALAGSLSACDPAFDDALALADDPEEGPFEELTPADPALPLETEASASKVDPKKKHLRGWMRWISALPWSEGPLRDDTGERCAMGQEGPVWYLVGTSGGPAERECDIPAGKQLVFPLVNQWCVFFPELYPTAASIADALPGRIDMFDANYDYTCDLTLRVDGEDVLPDFDAMLEDLYARVAEPFEIEMNADNFAAASGYAGGTMPAIMAGHFARLPPLAPGEHLLEFGGALCYEGEVFFETSATYTLHVAGD